MDTEAVRTQWKLFWAKIKNEFEKYGIDLSKISNDTFPIPATIGIILFIYFLHLLLRTLEKKKRKRKEVVLLMGPCDSGKTTFLFKLKTGRLCRTVTSMKENKAFVLLRKIGKSEKSQNYKAGENEEVGSIVKTFGKKYVQIVDLPGHPKLFHTIHKYLEITKVILFFLDSSNRQSLKEVARSLYELLTNQVAVRRKVPILIVCNKTDLSNSRPKQVIKEDLEKEIEILKMSKSVAMDEDEEEEGKEDLLGSNTEFFRFDLTPCEIKICSASVKDNYIEEITHFLHAHF